MNKLLWSAKNYVILEVNYNNELIIEAWTTDGEIRRMSGRETMSRSLQVKYLISSFK